MFVGYLYGHDWLKDDQFYYEIGVVVCDGGGFPWYHPSECIMMVPPVGWECE